MNTAKMQAAVAGVPVGSPAVAPTTADVLLIMNGYYSDNDYHLAINLTSTIWICRQTVKTVSLTGRLPIRGLRCLRDHAAGDKAGGEGAPQGKGRLQGRQAFGQVMPSHAVMEALENSRPRYNEFG